MQQTPPPSRRNRLPILGCQALVIAIGLWSRLPGGRFPFHYKSVGDILWATMFYFWILLAVVRVRVAVAMALTLLITFSIEFLKLYHAPWIDLLRAHRAAGFLLGHGFYWHDLASYLLGSLLASAADVGLLHRRNASDRRRRN